MSKLSELLPELAEWNNGAGVPITAWIGGVGRSDHALGYAVLFWPELVSFGDYVLRAPVDIEHLRGWEAAGTRRQQIETAMNMQFLELFFPDDDSSEELYQKRLDVLAAQMVEMLAAKLKWQFPKRDFSVFVIDDGDDFGVSFHQT